MLRAFVQQLLRTHDVLPLQLEAGVRGFAASPDLQDTTAWLNLLVQVCQEIAGTIYLVIDGIDECEDAIQTEFAKYAKSLFVQSNSIKFFLLSRPTIQPVKSLYENYLQKSQHISLTKVDQEGQRSEIKLFIAHALQEKIQGGALVVGDTLIMKEIEEALAQGAEGMLVNCPATW